MLKDVLLVAFIVGAIALGTGLDVAGEQPALPSPNVSAETNAAYLLGVVDGARQASLGGCGPKQALGFGK